MKINKVVAAVSILAMNALLIVPSVSAIKCPEGTLNSGKEMETLASCNVPPDDSLIPTVNTIINVIVGVLGIVAVVIIIIGGVNYILSMGDAGKLIKAKNTILYGVVGLVISLLAYAIVNFVLSSLSTKA